MPLPTTYSGAIDELFGIVNSIWPQLTGIAGYAPEIRWAGEVRPGKPDASKFWARVSASIVTDKLSTLSNVVGSKLFHATGLLYVQLFCPRNEVNPTVKGRSMAEIIRAQFRAASPSGNIWFRDQKIVELPSTEENYPINVVVTFEYDSSDVAVIPSVIPGLGSQFSGRHYPVEAIDGARTSFTFVGLPLNNDLFILVWNGIIQDGFGRVGNVITVDSPPVLGDYFYVFY